MREFHENQTFNHEFQTKMCTSDAFLVQNYRYLEENT